MDRAHLIPKQRLKHEGLGEDEVWDERVWVWMCRFHHHRLDNGFLKIDRAMLPSEVFEFATQHDLTWSLDRDYP